MAGAVILAARAAFRSGVGMVRLLVDDDSLAAVQSGAIEATAAGWPNDDDSLRALLHGFAHAVLLGPGLGRSQVSRELAERVLRVWPGPIVIDADALTMFAGELPRLRELLRGRPAVLTPHASEFARLGGLTLDDVLAKRFDAPAEMARTSGAVVLLKGVPTVIGEPAGTQFVIASGTPVLATAGSGDLLGGIIVTLLAQSGDAVSAAGCGAWVHGRAAEIANADRPVRGVTLADVIGAIAQVWRFDRPAPALPVLAELPAVGDRPAPSTSRA
jgi:ADP-dependent NAD(P)H-hydrate dehydratase / NAD(P)H-hydrate epimerase